MNDILIVPDIHGRKFWEPALDYSGEIIFLGDYVDPYSQEHITQADAYLNLQRIVKFKKNNPERVTLLIGNHELHYYDAYFESSRFSEKYYDRYHAILTDEETGGLFQICKQVENYLFIHAGITKGWYNLYNNELQLLGSSLEEQVNRLFIQNMDAFYEISYYRGGPALYGSPLWADVRELFNESEHFNNDIIQIIGHTQITSADPIIKGNIRLLDNRKLYLLREDRIVALDYL
jgi:hypothetical protein